MAVDKLNENFINELFKLALRNRRVFEVVSHHIKYQYLPNEHYKTIWKEMSKFNDVSQQLPTLGWLSQQFDFDKDIINVLAEIRNSQPIDKNDALQQFELFLKNAMFIEAYDQLGDLFVDGNRKEAFNLVKGLSEDLNNFVVKDQYYDKIFESVMDRNSERQLKLATKEVSKSKVPFGIDELDDITRGGADRGDTVCFLAQSGVGKSKLLKHIGVHGARRGFKMLHVQAEGTRQECLDAYDASIAGAKLSDLEWGSLSKDKLEKIEQSRQNVLHGGGEIFVESFEQFDTADLQDIRELIQDIERTYGKLDCILLDYFELFDPGDGKRYKVSEERQRREALANKLKNIAVEFDVLVVTCTQASTVAPTLLDDPEFVQTRYHISEFKGVIKPFSYFATMNQTKDEKANNFMRIYMDKVRKYKGGQIIKIYQNYDRERFYSKRKTLNEIYTPVHK